MATPKKPEACKFCKLSPPLVVMSMLRGKSRGVCNKCMTFRLRADRNKAKLSKPLKTGIASARLLLTHNYDCLTHITFGAYKLILKLNNKPIGYLIVLNGKVYVNTWNEEYLFKYMLYPISAFLADLNVIIDPIPVKALYSDQVGLGLPLEDASDRLVAFDVKLQDYAVKRLQRLIAEAKGLVGAKAGVTHVSATSDSTPTDVDVTLTPTNVDILGENAIADVLKT